MHTVNESGHIQLDRKRAREGSNFFYEAEVKDRRGAQYLATQIGTLPLEYQGLIHITDEDTWVHHGCLMTLPMLQVSRGEIDGDKIMFFDIAPLFGDGGKTPAARCPTCHSNLNTC